MPENDFYRMTAREALEALGSDHKGLTREEMDKRLGEHGPNEITTDAAVSKWLLFLLQFRDLLVLVLIAAGIISLAIGSFRNGAVMFIIVMINAVIGFIQEYKAGRILERLRDLIRSQAKVMIGGELQEMPQDLSLIHI